MSTTRKIQCWIPNQWRFEHPWYDQGTYPVPSELKAFTFTHIAHTTHTQEKDGIVRKEGFEAKQEVIKRSPGYSYQMVGSELRQLTEHKVFPGYYVFFAPIIPELDDKQKQACRTLIERSGAVGEWGVGKTEFSDYIEHHSRYGKWMFSMTIDEALELYKYSVEKEMETGAVIKFKLMGTQRYNSRVVYTVAVTAHLEGESDPLPEYQDWDQHTLASINDQKTIDFNPKAVVCIPEERHYTRDYIAIAFHFQNPESIFHLKSPTLDRSQPEEVFHHVCARSRMRGEICADKKPESEWETNQRQRFQTST